MIIRHTVIERREFTVGSGGVLAQLRLIIIVLGALAAFAVDRTAQPSPTDMHGPGAMSLTSTRYGLFIFIVAVFIAGYRRRRMKVYFR